MYDVRISKVVDALSRSRGSKLRNADISFGPKKKDCSENSVEAKTASVWMSVSCSYSRWLNVTRGGSLARRSSLFHVGRIEGCFAPLAISVTDKMK